jgi:hypothetical protein
VGSNCKERSSDWPGLKVAGNAAPETVKPLPVTVTELTVTGAVPVDVSVTVCVAGVFTATDPNETLVALMLSAGAVPEPGVPEFSSKAKVVELAPALAVKVTDWVVAAAETVASKLVLVDPDGTVTDAGTVTFPLLLERFTLSPSWAAALLSVTVQLSVPDPVMLAL